MTRFALLPLVFIGSTVAAQTAAPAKTTIAAADKPVCRVLTPTGSIMGTRVCRTRAQWVAADTAYERQRDKGGQSNTIDRSQGGDGQGHNSLGF